MNYRLLFVFLRCLFIYNNQFWLLSGFKYILKQLSFLCKILLFFLANVEYRFILTRDALFLCIVLFLQNSMTLLLLILAFLLLIFSLFLPCLFVLNSININSSLFFYLLLGSINFYNLMLIVFVMISNFRQLIKYCLFLNIFALYILISDSITINVSK